MENKMKKIGIIGVAIILMLMVSGCEGLQNITGDSAIEIGGELEQIFKSEIPIKISNLPLMKISSIENFEKYHSFSNDFNNLIKILNENNELFDIPLFDTTQIGFEKASKFITEYGPLINNYNEVILSAKNFKQNSNEENLKDFYLESGKFGFETALIVGTVYYGAAYKGVGIMYRAVGLNKFALKCGPCVSIILSKAHWFIRTVLVEGSSQLAQTIIETAEKLNKN